MPFESLGEYVEALEHAGQLKRVKAKTSPNLEIAEVMRRLMYSNGPAVLFENVEGSGMQVLGNAFGSMKRLEIALETEDFTEIGRRITELTKMKMPSGMLNKLKMLPKLSEIGEYGPKYVAVIELGGHPLILRPDEMQISRGESIRDASGRAVRVSGTIQDITAQRRSRAALRRSRRRLERAVADLERSNAGLEQFASVASHDLQEPLRMITSYLELLARRYSDRLDDDAREFIGYCVEGAERMKRLIDDLLAYSLVATAATEPSESVDVTTVLRTVLRGLAPQIRECGAEVMHGPLPALRVDRVQLEQLLQNLIANAIKFRGDRPPVIRVEAEWAGGEWVLSVRDNGIGIAAEFQDRVFNVFQRLHGRERYAGNGIGLSICKRIAERHGGRIWVEAAPGAGSTFFFAAPGGKEDADAARAA